MITIKNIAGIVLIVVIGVMINNIIKKPVQSLDPSTRDYTMYGEYAGYYRARDIEALTWSKQKAIALTYGVPGSCQGSGGGPLPGGYLKPREICVGGPFKFVKLGLFNESAIWKCVNCGNVEIVNKPFQKGGRADTQQVNTLQN